MYNSLRDSWTSDLSWGRRWMYRQPNHWECRTLLVLTHPEWNQFCFSKEYMCLYGYTPLTDRGVLGLVLYVAAKNKERNASISLVIPVLGTESVSKGNWVDNRDRIQRMQQEWKREEQNEEQDRFTEFVIHFITNTEFRHRHFYPPLPPTAQTSRPL